MRFMNTKINLVLHWEQCQLDYMRRLPTKFARIGPMKDAALNPHWLEASIGTSSRVNSSSETPNFKEKGQIFKCLG